MPFRFSLLSVLFLIPFGIGIGSFDELIREKHSSFLKNENLAVSKISVRESTVDLQVAVGETIFVFGKAKGTLDKVKVGMHVLPFSQVPGSQGNESLFSKVSWKRLKDGSIQIQSSYNPWPMTLTWTVLENGQLKMEASAPQASFENIGWLGLGFNFPYHQLNQVSWKGDKSLTMDNQGLWKNKNFTPMAESDRQLLVESESFFHQIDTVKLEFESVTVDVNSGTPGIYLGLRSAENQADSYPKIDSDLGFLFYLPTVKSEKLPSPPSENIQSDKSVSLNPLVLWFHFQ